MAEAGLDLFLENLPSLCCVGVALLGVSATLIRLRRKDRVIEVAKDIRSNADAARSVTKFYESLVNEGIPSDVAKEYVAH